MALDDTDLDLGGDQQSNAYSQDVQDQLERDHFDRLTRPSLTQTAPDTYAPPRSYALQTTDQTSAPVRPGPPKPYDSTGFKFDDDAQEFGFTPLTAHEDKTTWADLGRAAWGGTLQLGKDALGTLALANDHVTNSPQLRQWLNNWTNSVINLAEDNVNKMTPAAQKALQASWFDPNAPSPGEVGYGRWAVLNGMSFLPAGASLILPGGIAAKLVVKGLGMSARAGALASGAATFASGATQETGELYNFVHKEIGDASEATLMQSPTYAAARQHGQSDAEARLTTSKAAAPWILAGGALGAATGVGVGGSMLSRGGALGFMGRRALGAAEGAIPMGALGGGDVALHQALRDQLGQGQGYDTGEIARGAASGALGGAAIGGVLGARREPPRPVAQPEAPAVPDRDGVTAEQQAALQTPSPTELQAQQQRLRDVMTSTPAGYGPPGVGDQAEMFQPFEMGNAPPPGPGLPTAARQGEMFPTPGAGVTQSQTEAFPPVEMGPPRPAPGAGMPPEATQGEMFAQPTAAPVQPTAPARPTEAAPMAPTGQPAPTAPAPTAQEALAERMKSSGELLKETAAAKKAADAARPSAGMKVQELRDALVTMPGQDPRAIKRMNREDLARAYDQATQKSQSTPSPEVTTVAKGVEPVREPSAATPEPAVPQAAETEAPTAKPPPAPVAGSLPTAAQVGETPKPAPKPVVEKAPAPAPAPAPGTRPEFQERALEHLAAIRQSMGEIPPGLQRGQVNQAMKDFQTAISNAKSLDDLLAMLKTAQQAGTNLSKGIGLALETRLTGRRVRRTEPVEERPEHISEAEEVAREERARGESAAKVAPESIEETAVGQGPGGETMGLPTREAPVRKGTDYEAIGRSLINKVLDESDPMTVQQAAEQFGKQPPGPGRPRRATTKDFAARVEAELKRVDNPERAEKLREQLRQALIDEQGHEPEPGERRLSDRIEKTLEDYAPERIQKLHDMLRELADPTAKAADDTARLVRREEGRARMRDRLAERQAERNKPQMAPGVFGKDFRESRYVQMSRDSRLEVGLVRMMREAENAGRHLMSHDVARYIAQDPLVRAETPPFARFAAQLLRLMPNIPVYSHDYAYERGLFDRGTYRTFRQAYGFTNLSDLGGGRAGPAEFIIVNIDKPHLNGTHVGTFLHEAVHSVTGPYIDHLMHNAPEHPHLKAMELIFNELLDHARLENWPESSIEGQNVTYALQNPHELSTMALQDPTVHAFMARTQPSEWFKGEMAKLGYAPGQTRSVWRYFTDWVRKALGMQGPASASEYSLLDHVLRPMQDVADAGATYNKRFLPKDPDLRGPAGTLAWNADAVFSPRTRELAGDALGSLRGFTPRTRRAILATAPLDRIVERYAPLAQDGERNYLENVRTAVETMDHAVRQFLDKYKDRTTTLTRQLAREPDVASLMNDVGYAKASLGTNDPAANAHLKTADERAQLADLQARFDRLTPAQQTLYREVRDLQEEKRAYERNALVEGQINSLFPGVTDAAQRAELNRALRSKQGIEAFLAKPENANIDAGIARGIEHLREMGQVPGDYFPMRRNGDYVVVHGDKNTPEYGVHFFERKAEADAFRQQLLADQVPGVQAVRERNSIIQETAQRLSPVVEEMLRKIEQDPKLKPHAEELRQLAAQLQLQHAGTLARARARRRLVQGASKDIARSINEDLGAQAFRVAHLEHGVQREQALRELGYHADSQAIRGSDAAFTLDQVHHELRKRFDAATAVRENGPAGLLRRSTSFGFAHSLLSFSRLFTETMEMHGKMGAFIGARHGPGRAAIELGRAMRQLAPSGIMAGARNTKRAVLGQLRQADYDLSKLFRQRLLDAGYDRREVASFFDHFAKTGLFDATTATALRDLAHAKFKAWDWFLNATSAMTHASDELNRVAGAWAAFRAQRGARANNSIGDALRFAEDTLRKAPNFSPANRPRIATERGPLGAFSAPIMQFKLYGMNEGWLMANLIHAIRDPAARKEAALGLAGMVAVHSMLAGVLTWWADPARYIGGMYDFVTGHKPMDRSLQARKFLADHLGNTLGELVGRGLPHAIGMDLHRRLGVENMLNIPELKGFKRDDLAAFFGELALGAPGTSATDMAQGVGKLLDGDATGALKQLLPRIVADPVKAYDLATKGVTDTTGQARLPPEKLSTRDVALQALGFAPSRVTEFREGRNAEIQERNRIEEDRSALTNAWLNAAPADRPAIMSQIRDYNSDPYHRGFTITVQNLLKDLQSRRKQAMEPFGLRMPRGSQLSGAGGFANY